MLRKSDASSRHDLYETARISVADAMHSVALDGLSPRALDLLTQMHVVGVHPKSTEVVLPRNYSPAKAPAMLVHTADEHISPATLPEARDSEAKLAMDIANQAGSYTRISRLDLTDTTHLTKWGDGGMQYSIHHVVGHETNPRHRPATFPILLPRLVHFHSQQPPEDMPGVLAREVTRWNYHINKAGRYQRAYREVGDTVTPNVLLALGERAGISAQVYVNSRLGLYDRLGHGNTDPTAEGRLRHVGRFFMRVGRFQPDDMHFIHYHMRNRCEAAGIGEQHALPLAGALAIARFGDPTGRLSEGHLTALTTLGLIPDAHS